MKTIDEIMSIVATGLANKVKELGEVGQWVICADRIFVNDYVPQYEEYTSSEQVTDSADIFENAPDEGPYDKSQIDWDNAVFAVIKADRGQMNQGFMLVNVSITILTCNHEIGNPRSVLLEYASDVNFEYLNGVVQAYFSPSLNKSMQEAYNGFRAVISMSGTVKVPTSDEVLFLTNIYYKSISVIYGRDIPFGTDIYVLGEDGYETITVSEHTDFATLDGTYYIKDSTGVYINVLYKKQNFVTYAFGDSKAQDPQAFLNDSLYGITQNVNRQGTITLSFSTFLFNGDEFTSIIMDAMKNQNTFVDVALRMSGMDGDTEPNMWYEGSMSITGHTVQGEWGGIAQFMITMTSGGYTNG